MKLSKHVNLFYFGCNMLTLGLTLKPWEGKSLVFPPCFSVHMVHKSGKIPSDWTCGWITFIVQLFTDVCVRERGEGRVGDRVGVGSTYWIL